MILRAGTQLRDLTLQQRLGVGGMAEVWSATRGLGGEHVALKVLFQNNPVHRARLLREGRAQAVLDHPNVLPVREVVQADGVLGLVLPLVEGPTLQAVLSGYRPTPSEALRLLRALTSGVEHAHQHGLIHRDLKPGNVLLDRQGDALVPRVTDFGLVKDTAEASLTRSGAFMGTLGYAAPEQLLDAARVDTRADLFSLGVILVELLTGHLPFQASSVGALLAAYRAGPDLSGAPAHLQPLCAALLAEAPGERPPDCAALLAVLRALSSELDAPLPAAGGLGRASQAAWSQRADMQHTQTEAADTCASLVLEGESLAPLPPHNLPQPQDTFVGRLGELQALKEQAQPGTLVSVLGVGGTGKTRLVLAHARRQLRHYPGGVWLCRLSEARSAAAMLHVLAQVLDVPLTGDDDHAQLGHAIAGRGRCLLILDNVEQLAEHAAQAVAQWRPLAPAAAVLVTSRVPLGLPGEQRLQLAPLAPTEAAALFLARARDRLPGLSLTPGEAEHIDQLVTQLDCLPLAIELAASRIAILRPEAMLARMRQRFRLLSSSGQGLPPRQATMRAAIDWSWALLEDWEQAAFAQCSVFQGGFILEAAEAVLDLDGFDGAPWPLDAVQSLVDKSLLQARPDGLGGTRLGMYVSLREYASEKLAATGQVEAVWRRHAAHYARMGRSEGLAALERHGGAQQWWALAAELDNLTAAARRATDPEVALLAVTAACEILQRRGPLELGAALLQELRDRLDADSTACQQQRGRALLLAGRIEMWRGNLTEAGAHGEAARLLLEPHSRTDSAAVESLLGFTRQRQGRLDEALAHLRDARALLAGRPDQPRAQASLLLNMGNVLRAQGALDDAAALLRDALDQSRAAGSRQLEGKILNSIAFVQLGRGDLPDTLEHLQQAHVIAQEVGDLVLEGHTLINASIIESRQGRFSASHAHLRAALELYARIGSLNKLGNILCNLGGNSYYLADLAAAEEHYRAALRLSRQAENRAAECDALAGLGAVLLRQLRVDEAEEVLAHALAATRSLGSRTGEAQVLTYDGARLAVCGDTYGAEVRLGEAISLADEVGARAVSVEARLQRARLHAEALRPAAIEELEEVLEATRQLGETLLEVEALLHVARLQRRAGRPDAAAEALQRARERAQATEMRLLHVELRCEQAALARERGALPEARASLDDAAALLVPADTEAHAVLLCEQASLCRAAGTPGAPEVIDAARRLIVALPHGAPLRRAVDATAQP